MPKQRVTVDVITPQWQWCDLQSKKRHGRKTGERCRFCHEMKKRGQNPRYFCLLFNVELTQKGDAVEKTCLCMQNWKKNQLIDLTVEPEKAAPCTPSASRRPRRGPGARGDRAGCTARSSAPARGRCARKWPPCRRTGR